MSTTTIRSANHTVITSSGAVHLAADSTVRPYHVLACNGRAVGGSAIGLSSDGGADKVTCKSCKAGVSSGRILVESSYTTDMSELRTSKRNGSSDGSEVGEWRIIAQRSTARLAELAQEMATVADERRAAVAALFAAGWTYQRIAAALGVTRSAVQKMV